MRTATLATLLFVAFGYAATAQKFTLLPKVGLENFRTSIRYNDLSSINPLCGLSSPHLGLRMDYKTRQGHGAFVGVSTSRSIVNFSFADPEAGMNSYEASGGKLRLRFEGGYQFNTKPIYFNKKSSGKTAALQQKSSSAVKERKCGSYRSAYRCGKSMEKSVASRSKHKGLSMRIQPSVGFAFIPTMRNDILLPGNGSTDYQYKAGNMSTAVVAGTSVEFGRNRQRLFTFSINYLRGLGNLETKTITSVSGIKTITTNLKSSVNGWNITAGIPITLDKKKSISKVRTYERTEKKEGGCGQYRIRYKKVI